MINNEIAKVSVIIPFFNSEKTIKRALDSVFAQSLPVAEVIVVNDASAAASEAALIELVEKFYLGRVKLINLDKNVGAGCARNEGWKAATQPYIAFLDSDDIWLQGKVRTQYDFMTSNDHIILTGHYSSFFSEGEGEKIDSYSYERVYFSRLIFKNKFITSSVMLKRNIGLRFLDRMRYSEDFLLWVLISRMGECGIIKIKLSAMFKPPYGHSGLSSNLIKMEKGELQVLYYLMRNNYLKLHQYFFASAFSLAKFFIRIIKTSSSK